MKPKELAQRIAEADSLCIVETVFDENDYHHAYTLSRTYLTNEEKKMIVIALEKSSR